MVKIIKSPVEKKVESDYSKKVYFLMLSATILFLVLTSALVLYINFNKQKVKFDQVTQQRKDFIASINQATLPGETPVMNYFPVSPDATTETETIGNLPVTVISQEPKKIIQTETPEIVSSEKKESEATYDDPIKGPLIPEPKVTPPLELSSQAKARLNWSPFGDSFSSMAWLDSSATNLVLDSASSALLFPANYLLSKEANCSLGEAICARVSNNYERACLGDNCLVVSDQKLFFNNSQSELPGNLKNKDIKKISVYALDKTWLVGLIFQNNKEEEVALLRFDGKNFSTLVGEGTKLKGITKFSKGNGSLGFGGGTNDFLFVYAGYESFAFHFRLDNGQDISDFFGLRVSSGGFTPQIVRAQDTGGVFWYITGFADGKLKFLKLWQNGTDHIEGLIDLSYIFSEKNIQPKSLVATWFPRASDRTLRLVIDDGAKEVPEIWRYVDLGFDNSKDRLVVSKNISNHQEQIKAVKISSLGLSLGLEKSNQDTFSNRAILQVSNNNKDWLGLNVNETLFFPDRNGNSLFWRARIIKSDSRDYSPYFSHLNSLEFAY